MTLAPLRAGRCALFALACALLVLPGRMAVQPASGCGGCTLRRSTGEVLAVGGRAKTAGGRRILQKLGIMCIFSGTSDSCEKSVIMLRLRGGRDSRTVAADSCEKSVIMLRLRGGRDSRTVAATGHDIVGGGEADEDEVMADADAERHSGQAAALDDNDDFSSDAVYDPAECYDGMLIGGDQFEQKLLNGELIGGDSSSELDENVARMRKLGTGTAEEAAEGMVAELRTRIVEGGGAALMANGGGDALEGMLIVPDDVDNIPTAVKAAAWVDHDEDPVPIFVRKGIHRWEGDVCLYEKWALDMPSGVEFLEGILQNSTEHYVYESQMELANSTHKRPRLILLGDAGALMWGRWVLELGSCGEFRDVQLLTDSRLTGDQVQDLSAATVEVISSNFSFSQCGVRSVKGVCMRIAEKSNVRMMDTALGGLGAEERSQCASCVTIWDHSTVAIGKCTMSDGMTGSAGLRVCGDSQVAARGCMFERLFTGVCLHDRALLSLVDCKFINQTHSAFFAGGKLENGTRLSIESCSIDSAVWADDGRPGKVTETNLTLFGLASESERMRGTLEQEVEEMKRKLAELEGMQTPEEIVLEALGRQGQELEGEMLVSGLTNERLQQIQYKLKQLRHAAMDATGWNKERLIESFGPDMEGWLESEDAGIEGTKGEEDLSWDSSDEPDQGGPDRADERELAKNEKLLSWVLKSVEKVPPQVRTERDLRILNDVPAMLEKVESIKRQLRDAK